MKAKIPWRPTKAAQRAMTEEINRQTIVADEKHYLDIVAMVLWALHVCKKTKFGKKRLRAFYDDFDKIHQELIDYYKMADDHEWLVHYKLREIGVDVKAWSEEVGT